MGLSAVTYALSKKYTDKTVIGLGGLKGAPCKVKSVVKTDGRSVVTLEWKGDDGTTQTSEIYVNDGTSVWIPGRDYAVNDIVIKDDTLYICKVANSDVSFDDTKWSIVVSGGSDVKIRELTQAQYDALTPAEKMNGTIYFVTDAGGGEDQQIQVTTMPTPSASELNNIYQYVGNTTSVFQNGCFYKCIFDYTSSSYAWLAIVVEAYDAFEDEPIDFDHF